MLSACTGKPPAPDALRVHLHGEPVSLDPALAEDGLSLKVLSQVMEGLVGYDGEGKLQPRLAESYSISQDGRRIEFTLRSEAKWSDGKPVTAEEMILGFRRALAPSIASKLAEMLTPIRGAREYRAGKRADLPGVRAENGKLVVELERKSPYFLQALALPDVAPAREDILKNHGGKWPEGPKASAAPATGPYRISEYVSGQKITLERNPHYWGGLAGIPRVELLLISDESTASNLFDHGKVDILTRVSSVDFKRYEKQGKMRVEPFFATYYLAFNCRKEPFQDRDWRRAIAGSIDRKELTDLVGTGETPARSWVSLGLEGYLPYEDPAPVFADSVARVKPKAASHAPITAQFDASSRNSTVMERVQQDVLQRLGLKLSLVQQDWKSHVKAIRSDAPPIFRFGWQAAFHDPLLHLQAFVTGNPNSFTGCSFPKYDQLVREIEEMPSGQERARKIREAQKILVDDEAAVVPLYHYIQGHAVAPRVKNFRANPFGVIRFSELELARP